MIGKSELEEKKVTVKNIAHKEQETIRVDELIPYVDSLLEEEVIIITNMKENRNV